MFSPLDTVFFILKNSAFVFLYLPCFSSKCLLSFALLNILNVVLMTYSSSQDSLVYKFNELCHFWICWLLIDFSPFYWLYFTIFFCMYGDF